MDAHVEAFLHYDYGALNDLTKIGLALSSASFGFYIAYADKVIDVAHATLRVRRYLNVAMWLLICSVGLCLLAFGYEYGALTSLRLAWLRPEDVAARLPRAASLLVSSELFLCLAAAAYLVGLGFVLWSARHVTEASAKTPL